MNSEPKFVEGVHYRTDIPETEGVVKIAISRDGVITVNSEIVSINNLQPKLDSLKNTKSYWYHRDSPERFEPHENGLKVIQELSDRGLPIAMYLDPEFTKRAIMRQAE